MQNNQLSPGFITVEEAIALIQKDKRDEAVVDLQFLTNNIPYLEKKKNFTIRLMKHTTDPKTNQRKVVRNGTVYTYLASDYEVQILMKAIRDAFEARTNIHLNLDEPGINKVTSMIDEEQQINTPTLRENTQSETKVGTDISSPYNQTLQGV